MRVAVVGERGSGKSALFRALCGEGWRNGEFVGRVGSSAVYDERLDAVARVSGAERVTPVRLEFSDFDGMGSAWRDERAVRITDVLADFDCVVMCVGGFLGRDAAAELELLRAKLASSDLARVMRRLEALPKLEAKGKARAEERGVMERVRDALSRGEPFPHLSAVERSTISSFRFCTSLPSVVVLSADEACTTRLPGTLRLSPVVEAEAEALGAEGKREYLEECGFEPTRALGRACLAATGSLSFFTTDGVRANAWTLPVGSTALDAAAQVHTDLAEGFVRAVVAPWDAFVSAGGWGEELQRRYTVGKDAPVSDGDAVLVRASRGTTARRPRKG